MSHLPSVHEEDKLPYERKSFILGESVLDVFSEHSPVTTKTFGHEVAMYGSFIRFCDPSSALHRAFRIPSSPLSSYLAPTLAATKAIAAAPTAAVLTVEAAAGGIHILAVVLVALEVEVQYQQITLEETLVQQILEEAVQQVQI